METRNEENCLRLAQRLARLIKEDLDRRKMPRQPGGIGFKLSGPIPASPETLESRAPC